MTPTQEDSERQAQLAAVKAAEEAERQDRITHPLVPDHKLDELLAAMQHDLTSAASRKEAAAASHDESLRAAAERQKELVLDALLHHVHAALAKSEAQHEQQRLIAAHHKAATQEELERVVAQKSADAAAAAEQARRMTDHTPLSPELTAALGAVRAQLVASFPAWQHDHVHQAREVVRARMADVAEDIERRGAAAAANAAMDAELAARLAQGASVAGGADAAAAAAVQEVVRAELVAQATKRSVREAEHEEQLRRVTLDCMAAVGEELVRRVNQRAADAAADTEQAERIVADKLAAVGEELLLKAALLRGQSAAVVRLGAATGAEAAKARVLQGINARNADQAEEQARAEQAASGEGNVDSHERFVSAVQAHFE
jgi:hypothetical protein